MVCVGPRRHCHRLMFDGVTCSGITKARAGMGGCKLGQGETRRGMWQPGAQGACAWWAGSRGRRCCSVMGGMGLNPLHPTHLPGARAPRPLLHKAPFKMVVDLSLRLGTQGHCRAKAPPGLHPALCAPSLAGRTGTSITPVAAGGWVQTVGRVPWGSGRCAPIALRLGGDFWGIRVFVVAGPAARLPARLCPRPWGRRYGALLQTADF